MDRVGGFQDWMVERMKQWQKEMQGVANSRSKDEAEGSLGTDSVSSEKKGVSPELGQMEESVEQLGPYDLPRSSFKIAPGVSREEALRTLEILRRLQPGTLSQYIKC